MAPFCEPTSMSIRISSSVTASSSWFGSMRSRRRMPLVEAVSSETMGLKSVEMKAISPDRASASFSAFFIASRLGTSSPNTSVK